MTQIKTADNFRVLLKDLPGPDEAASAAAAAREPQLTKPPGALGRLEELSGWLARWQGAHPPRLAKPHVVVFAGNHGVAAQGVSAFPAEVTVQMVANFKAGGAAVNQLAKANGASFAVVPLDLDTPSADFTQGPALDEARLVQALQTGMDNVPDDIDLLCLGEMGIANTTAAAAICLALYKGWAEDWVGPGTGVTGSHLSHKAVVVESAALTNRRHMTDALDVLTCLGGLELAAMAGAIIAARLKRIPVLLDGYVCCAAAAPLHALNSGALDHCQVAHVSAEPGHHRLLENLHKKPLLDLGMRLGEASGAALAIGLIRGAVACHTGMSTFAEAGVSDA